MCLSLVYKSERQVAKEFLVFLSHESPPTVGADLDLGSVQVDEDSGVAQIWSSVTVGVVTVDDYHWLLCHQVYGKLLVHLLLLVHKPHVSVVLFLPVLQTKGSRQWTVKTKDVYC